jgi:hypothetical protein
VTRYLIMGPVISLVVGCGGPRYQTYNTNRLDSSAIYSVDEARCNLEAQKNVKRVIADSRGSALDRTASMITQMGYDRQYQGAFQTYQRNCMAAKGWTLERRRIPQ